MPRTRRTVKRQNEGSSAKASFRLQPDRPTIALLLDDVHYANGIAQIYWQGVADAARERDVNLLSFAGQALGADPAANVIYDLLQDGVVDGLIIEAGGLALLRGIEAVQEFCARYQPLPMVNLEIALPDIPAVLMDDYQSMYEAIAHLIEDHGRRRIVFVQGPAHHVGAQERYRAYRQALADHQLPFDAGLVTPPAESWSIQGIYEDVSALVGSLTMDAVAGASANLALEMIRVLQARHILVPEHVSVVGFDDISEAALSMPTLTTVRPPHQAMGRQALDMVLAQIAGESVPDQVLLGGELILRESCGCLSPEMAEATRHWEISDAEVPSDAESWLEKLEARGVAIQAAMRAAMDDVDVGIEANWPAVLFTVLLQDLSAPPGSDAVPAFISTLGELVRHVAERQGPVGNWQNVLSILRRGVLESLQDVPEVREWAEGLFGQGRILIGQRARQAQGRQMVAREAQSEALRTLAQTLSACQTQGQLLDIVATNLPRFDIADCYMALYTHAESIAQSRLVVAFAEGTQIPLASTGVQFDSRLLIPADILPAQQRLELVVLPLRFRGQRFGFVMFGSENYDGLVLHALSDEISSALQNVAIRYQAQHRAVQLQTAAEVSRTIGAILDPAELIQQVVELVRERFDLYYAGLFLLEEDQAVLRAGTGEAGRTMLEQGHRLEIADDSMIGWCITHRQARIASDVAEERIRFGNPLLPETRSELALPLISRGDVVGALTIQSVHEDAFSAEDVTVLQTLADQLAGVLENARLFESTQAALREMEATQRRYQQRAWSEYAQVAPVTSYETQRSDRTPLGDKVLPEIQAALKRSEPTVLREPGAGTALVMPITQRGAAIGALGVHLEDTQRELTEDELALVQVVAERVGLVAETLRLLDETQRSAAQERLVGEVTSRVRATLDMNTILQTAVREIAQALDAQQAELRLGTAPSSKQ